MLELVFTSKQSLCCMCFFLLDLCLGEQSIPAVRAESEHQAEALPQAQLSLLSVLKAAGRDRAVGSDTGEVCQVPKYWDSMSGVGGQCLMRPSHCCASAWQESWCVFGLYLQPTQMIHSKESWPGCFSHAVGTCLIRQNGHQNSQKKTEGSSWQLQRPFPQVLLGQSFIKSILGGRGNCARWSQPKGPPLES